MHNQGRTTVGTALVAAVALATAGCFLGARVKEPEPVARNLSQIVDAYGLYLADSGGRPPRKASDLGRYLKEHGDPDTILRSPRDNQPFIISWGTNLNEGVPGGKPAEGEEATQPRIFIHEQQGSGGRRFVALTDGSVEELDQAAFDSTPKVQRR